MNEGQGCEKIHDSQILNRWYGFLKMNGSNSSINFFFFLIFIINGNLYKHLMSFEFTISPSTLLFIREGGAIWANALWHDSL